MDGWTTFQIWFWLLFIYASDLFFGIAHDTLMDEGLVYKPPEWAKIVTSYVILAFNAVPDITIPKYEKKRKVRKVVRSVNIREKR